MIGTLLLVMMIAPAAASLGCLAFHRNNVAEHLNLSASIIVLATALPLVAFSAGGPFHFWGSYIVIDMPGAWVILCTAIVYLLASVYAVGYMRLLEEEEGKLWSFYALFSGFALTILV